MTSGIKGAHVAVQEVDEIMDFEDLAGEAFENARVVPTAVSCTSAPGRLERCSGCRGSGYQLGPMTHLWGHNCWGCSGWGRVLSATVGPMGPFQGDPGRSLMQSNRH
jgi:hypothetical protein